MFLDSTGLRHKHQARATGDEIDVTRQIPNAITRSRDIILQGCSPVKSEVNF
jgi:hypothetical protein